MIFVTGFDHDAQRFTLTSDGERGKPNVEEFESVYAIDFKIDALEKKGHRIMIAPCVQSDKEELAFV